MPRKVMPVALVGPDIFGEEVNLSFTLYSPYRALDRIGRAVVSEWTK
jgi:hypothetical protein